VIQGNVLARKSKEKTCAAQSKRGVTEFFYSIFASFHLLDSKIQNEVKFGQAFVHVAPLELWNVVCELGRNLVLDDCGRNCWPSDNPVKAKRNMARACDLLLSL